MRIYVSGPMRSIKQFNFPAFFSAERELRAAGHEVFNPARHDMDNGFDPADMTGNENLAATGFDLRAALGTDLAYITANADAVAVLPGWENSAGAKAEVATAEALGLLVGEVRAFTPSSGLVDSRYLISVQGHPKKRVKALPPLVGFGGKLASGKDTAADWLVENRGYVKVFMSEPLHRAMAALNPIIASDGAHRYNDEVAAFGYTDAKKDPEVRALLQRLGTDVGRKIIGEDVWVDIAGRKIDAIRERGFPVVITGLRFPNEVEMIRARGGALWWTERVWPEGHANAAAIDAHASENGVDFTDFDLIIENSTLDLFYESVEALADSVATS